MPGWLQGLIMFGFFAWGYGLGKRDANEKMKEDLAEAFRVSRRLQEMVTKLKTHIIAIKWDVEKSEQQKSITRN